MWCRVLLYVIALTCTFQRAIAADTDDLLCVVYLSGLQKEDLDLNLLKKLQRHNVNIDDIYDRKTIDKCIPRSSSDKSKENEPATEIIPTKSIRSEQSFTQADYIINETIKVEESSKESSTPSYENFVELWIALNKTNQRNEVKTNETEKGMTVKLPLSFEIKTKNNSQESDLDYIHNMFERYFSPIREVTTIKPTTINYQQQNQADIVSQRIIKILNSNIDLNKTFVIRRYEIANARENNQNDNEIAQVQATSKDHGTKMNFSVSKIGHNISRNTLPIPNYENFINLWKRSNKIDHQDNKDKTTNATEKNITEQLPFIIDIETNTSAHSKDLDFIRKMLESYLSYQAITTIKPATTIKETDIVSQQIRKFLRNYNNNHVLSKEKNRNTETNNLSHLKSLAVKSDLISNKLLAQKHHLVTPSPLEQHFQNVKQSKINLRTIKTRSNVSERIPISNKDISIDPQSVYIDTLKTYIAAQFVQTSTQQPILTLQEIKEFLGKNDINKHKVTADNVLELFMNGALNAYTPRDQNVLTHNSVPISTNNELYKKDYKITPRDKDILKTNSKDENQKNIKKIQANDNKRIQINNSDCHSKKLDHIFHMFETYIASKNAENAISQTTTTPKDFDSIAQKVKDYLDNGDAYRRVMVTPVPTHSVPKADDINDKLLVTRKIDYMKELHKQANRFKKLDSPETSGYNEQQSNKYSQKVQHKVLKEDTLNDTIKTDTKPLSEDVIRQITEQVKASILKDLQKQIPITIRPVTKEITANTTTANIGDDIIDNVTKSFDNSKRLIQRFKKESGLETTTGLPLTGNEIKLATNALENFMELFKQFKHVTDITTIPNDLHTLTQKGKTKNEFHGPINVVYPTLLPLNYVYNVNNTRDVNSIFFNPYGLQINNPTVQKTKINDIKKFQYSSNPEEHAIQASVIQTDDAQVPLLGIPVSKSVSPINQNIIVTTKYPMIQIKEDQEHRNPIKKPKFQDYTVHVHEKYDTEPGRQSNIDMERHTNTDLTRIHSDVERAYKRDYINWLEGYPIYNHEKRSEEDHLLSRSKQANTDNFYKEYLSNIRAKNSILWDLAQFPQINQKKKIQENPELPDEWNHRYRARETPKREKRLKVASRQQLSMNDLKKRYRYDDSSYINLLKSQNKVNDILEKILKPTDRDRSVEVL